MSLRIINLQYKTNLKRGMFVEVQNVGIGQITKSSWDGYLYIKINSNKIKVHPKYVKEYKGFVGCEYNI